VVTLLALLVVQAVRGTLGHLQEIYTVVVVVPAYLMAVHVEQEAQVVVALAVTTDQLLEQRVLLERVVAVVVVADLAVVSVVLAVVVVTVWLFLPMLVQRFYLQVVHYQLLQLRLATKYIHLLHLVH
jgi:hypothetical protein